VQIHNQRNVFGKKFVAGGALVEIERLAAAAQDGNARHLDIHARGVKRNAGTPGAAKMRPQFGVAAAKRGRSASSLHCRALKKSAARSRLQSSLTAKARSAVIEIEVRNAKTKPPRAASRKRSPLLAGENRLLPAATPTGPHFRGPPGGSGVSLTPRAWISRLAGIPVLRRGQPLNFNERAASKQTSCRTRSAGCGSARG